MLLPWYVNGTLQTGEKSLVETHLKVCLQCRAELVEQQKISLMVNSEDPFTVKADASFSLLQSRIHRGHPLSADQAGKGSVFTGFVQRIAGFFKTAELFRHAFFAPAMIALLGVIFFIRADHSGSYPDQEHQFRTLSSSQRSQLKSNEIRVVFAGNVQKTRMAEIIAPFDGEIISGPSAQGVYIIRVDMNAGKGKDISGLVAGLRNNSDVIFAEPALSALSPLNPG